MHVYCSLTVDTAPGAESGSGPKPVGVDYSGDGGGWTGLTRFEAVRALLNKISKGENRMKNSNLVHRDQKAGKLGA
jgi:hypothetical protein